MGSGLPANVCSEVNIHCLTGCSHLNLLYWTLSGLRHYRPSMIEVTHFKVPALHLMRQNWQSHLLQRISDSWPIILEECRLVAVELGVQEDFKETRRKKLCLFFQIAKQPIINMKFHSSTSRSTFLIPRYINSVNLCKTWINNEALCHVFIHLECNSWSRLENNQSLRAIKKLPKSSESRQMKFDVWAL